MAGERNPRYYTVGGQQVGLDIAVEVAVVGAPVGGLHDRGIHGFVPNRIGVAAYVEVAEALRI